MRTIHKPKKRGKFESAIENVVARLTLSLLLMLAFAAVGKAEEESIIERHFRSISFSDSSNAADESASYGANALFDGGFKTAMVSVGNKVGGISLNININE